MVDYTEGLNFVPLLARTSTPHTQDIGRTRLNRSHRGSSISLPNSSLICYNGNYEGDSSMFGHKSRLTKHYSRMNLVETDSDNEYKKELDKYVSAYGQKKSRSKSIGGNLQRIWHYSKQHIIPPKYTAKLCETMESLQGNCFVRNVFEVMQFVGVLLVWLLQFVLAGIVKLGNWSYVFWKSRSLLRNAARRLLWWMTLAKCGDLTLFTLILLLTPVLFMVAFVGFILALYCSIKDRIGQSSYFVRNQLLH